MPRLETSSYYLLDHELEKPKLEGGYIHHSPRVNGWNCNSHNSHVINISELLRCLFMLCAKDIYGIRFTSDHMSFSVICRVFQIE